MRISKLLPFFLLTASQFDCRDRYGLHSLFCVCRWLDHASRSAGATFCLPTFQPFIVVAQGILFTPICPHSLSFRPIIFPDSVVLKLQIPAHFSGHARVTTDGEAACKLMPGDAVLVRVSHYPVPCLTLRSHTVEWMRSLADCLHWYISPFSLSVLSHKLFRNARVLQRGPVVDAAADDSLRRSSVDVQRAPMRSSTSYHDLPHLCEDGVSSSNSSSTGSLQPTPAAENEAEAPEQSTQPLELT